MRHHTLALPALLTTAALATGCANYATLADPDTVPKGSTKVGIGASFTNYKVDFDTEDNDPADTVSVPALNVSVRHGFTDKLEGNVKVWIPLGSSAGAKYQLVGHRDEVGPQLSVGADLGYMTIETDVNGEKSKATLVDLYLPVSVGYRLSPGMSVYASPKYILRSAFGDASGMSHLAGSTVGLSLGSKTKFMVEATGMYDLTDGTPIYNGALGVQF